MMTTIDTRGRVLKDLRISVTDRCNFRCGYCMPAEIFGPQYQFLPQSDLLTFEEITRITKVASQLGVSKIRLTGGEPLLRKGIDDLVAMLASIEGIDDLALTTNGILLSHYAERLALAGLSRVTVSLDALDPVVFAEMNGVGAKVNRVLAGIQNAQLHGLPVKVNAVIKNGVNDQEILPLANWARETGVTMRFIEFMDVGESNGWESSFVFPAAQIVERIRSQFPLSTIEREGGAVANRYQYSDGKGEVGVISSITQPFCHDCGRLRLSAQGELFGCLFAEKGTPIREHLRSEMNNAELEAVLKGMWSTRSDRYSELRGQVSQKKVEMSYIGG